VLSRLKLLALAQKPAIKRVTPARKQPWQRLGYQVLHGVTGDFSDKPQK
jgi:hypothetical protein